MSQAAALLNKARAPLALLTAVAMLGGCVGSAGLFQRAVPVDHLDGDYRRLASCANERLSRDLGRLQMTELPQQGLVRIAFARGSEKQWELSFVNEDGGRQTRLEVTTIGSHPSEHVLALVRACAA